jgi:hypothetical protein
VNQATFVENQRNNEEVTDLTLPMMYLVGKTVFDGVQGIFKPSKKYKNQIRNLIVVL